MVGQCFFTILILTSGAFKFAYNMDVTTTESLKPPHFSGDYNVNVTDHNSVNNATSEINNNFCNYVSYGGNISATFDNANQRLRLLIAGATNWFIAKIQDQPFPDYLLSDDDLQDGNRMLDSVQKKYKEWLSYERGFIIVTLICCLLAIVFGLVYTVYSCCCCGTCGRSNGSPGHRAKRIYTEQYSSWKRFFSNAILFLIIAISSLLLTIAFLCNHYLNRSICAGGETLIKSVDDFGLYQNETNAALKRLLIDDYVSANTALHVKLNDASEKFVSFTFQSLNSTLLGNFSNFASDLENTNHFVKNAQSIVLDVETELRLLETNVTGALQTFSSELSDCLNSQNDEEKGECSRVKVLVDQYGSAVQRAIGNAIHTITDYKTLISSLIQSLSISSINNSVNDNLETFRSDLRAKLQQQRSGIDVVLDKVADSLNTTWATLSRSLYIDTPSQLKGHIAKHDAAITYHEYYRWLTIVIICSLCAFILAGLFIGLLFSSFGSRPRFLDNGCCSSSKSTYCFSSSIFFGIFFLSGFMCLTCLLFVVGGNSRVILCHNFPEMDGHSSPLFKILERYWEIYKGNFGKTKNDRDAAADFTLLSDYNLSTILSGCRDGKTFYSIFDFDTRLNVNETLDVHRQIEKSSKHYVQKLKLLELDFSFVESFQDACNRYSEEVRQALDSKHLSSNFLEEAKINITAFNFDQDFRSMVDAAANELTFPSPKRRLSTLLVRLNELNTKNVAHIRQRSLELFGALERLSTEQLTKLALSVDKILTTNTSSIVKSVNGRIVTFSEVLANDLLGSFTQQAHNYTTSVRSELETNVTSCLPVQKIVANLGETMCDKIIDPFNSLWMCVGLVLLLFIPAILLASSLKKLYFNAVCYDADSGSNDSHRCIVDAYSTVTDDYGCYRRCSNSSYNDPVGRNHNVQHIKYPTDRQNYSEVDSYLPPPYYSRR